MWEEKRNKGSFGFPRAATSKQWNFFVSLERRKSSGINYLPNNIPRAELWGSCGISEIICTKSARTASVCDKFGSDEWMKIRQIGVGALSR
jgi:hypothetical protein